MTCKATSFSPDPPGDLVREPALRVGNGILGAHVQDFMTLAKPQESLARLLSVELDPGSITDNAASDSLAGMNWKTGGPSRICAPHPLPHRKVHVDCYAPSRRLAFCTKDEGGLQLGAERRIGAPEEGMRIQLWRPKMPPR